VIEQGLIAVAGLDVYADEPNVPERLLRLDNAVLLSNLAAYFETGRVKVLEPSAT